MFSIKRCFSLNFKFYGQQSKCSISSRATSAPFNRSSCLLNQDLVTKYNNGKIFKAVNCWQYSPFHSSMFLRDDDSIPEYLIDSISEVNCTEQKEDNVAPLDSNFEDTIADYFNSRCINYEEADSSFIVQCPSCSNTEKSQSQDVFVDKHSGYYVCPWCCGAGGWEELCRLLDARTHNLTEAQLNLLLQSSQKVDSNSKLGELSNLPLKQLQLYDCRLNAEETRLIVPIYSGASEKNAQQNAVGYYSVSLSDTASKPVMRCVKGVTPMWCSSSLPPSAPLQQKVVQKSNDTAIVVSDVCEAIFLSQLGYTVITLSCSEGATEWSLPPNVKSLIMWLTKGATLPYQFYSYLHNNDVTCRAVSPAGDVPLHQRRMDSLATRLNEELVPLFSEKIMNAGDLQEKVYYRLMHRNEVHGVPWKRFPHLQTIMLGHRAGEVTVLSGPTGSGKTTFMSEYSLDLAQQGVVTLWASLEVSIVRLCEVLLQQYSGNSLPHNRQSFLSLVEQFKQIPLHFLDLHGQQDIKQIMQVLRESIVLLGTRHVIIDNLQFLVGCQDSATERWLHQDRAMAAFRTFATQNNCHVTLIVHPRKLKEDEHLTLQAVGGGARVTQEADNVMLLQVIGKGGKNVRKAIEVVKNRYGGHLGIVQLKFHAESLTLSNFFRQNKPLKPSVKEEASKYSRGVL